MVTLCGVVVTNLISGVQKVTVVFCIIQAGADVVTVYCMPTVVKSADSELV